MMLGTMKSVWAVVRMVSFEDRGYVCFYSQKERAQEHARLATEAIKAVASEKGLISRGSTPYDPSLQWITPELRYIVVEAPFAVHVDQFLELYNETNIPKSAE